MKVEARERGESVERRCPICHGPFTAVDALWECPECRAEHHEVCARSHGRCAVLGCRGVPPAERLAPRDHEADRRAWRRELVLDAIFWAVFVTAGVASIVGIADGMRRMKEGVLMTSTAPVLYTPLAIFLFAALAAIRFRDRLR